MSKQHWERLWRVVAYDPDSETKKTWDQDTGLKLEFHIKKTGDLQPNEGTITLINLNKDSREFLKKKHLIITLEAGYKYSDFGLIFKGTTEFSDSTLGSTSIKGKNSVNITHAKDETDWRTDIQAKDAIKQKRNVIVSKSYSSGTNNKTILNDIIKEITGKGMTKKGYGLTKGVIKELVEYKFNHGRTLSGTAMDILKKFSAENNVSAFVDDGVINVIGNNSPVSDTAIVLDSTTSLIGSPQPTEAGYIFKSLLLPQVKPRSLLKVKSIDSNGYFIVTNINFTGDSESESWYSEMEAIPRGNV